MQFIVNCYVPWEDGFVMLQKPRRGWWYLPGGKVENDELWRDAAMREFQEETGLSLTDAQLAGVYRVRMARPKDNTSKERLIAQFIGYGATGDLHHETREGKLAVVTAEELMRLPMDEGDRRMVQHTAALHRRGDTNVIFGRFEYNANHQVLQWMLDRDDELND